MMPGVLGKQTGSERVFSCRFVRQGTRRGSGGVRGIQGRRDYYQGDAYGSETRGVVLGAEVSQPVGPSRAPGRRQ